MTFLGIDIGTSAVKAVLVDGDERVLAAGTVPLAVSRPRPGWSEQDPEAWWQAAEQAVAALRDAAPGPFAAAAAIGLSGQMHGAVLLGADDRPLRPAILWDDGRASAECDALAAAVPGLAAIAGVVAMPGFTAPKLLWLARHEPAAFARTARIALAKDVVRLRMTGTFATDMTDAAGTLLLDEAARDWSAPVMAACGINRTMLPAALEGPAVSGTLRPAVAAAWGLAAGIPVAAGGGDAAAGAVGIGAVEDGDAFLSLGTSAQLFVTRDRYEPKPATLVHAFAHALPGRWFEMAAMLNGAAVLDWAARLLGMAVGDLLARAGAGYAGPSRLVFLPHLAGERTPYNDPDARGGFFGLDAGTTATDLARAAVEGLVLSLMDGQRALGAAGRALEGLGAVGGGARSPFLMRLVASGLRLPVSLHAGGDKGPAFGAARLARLALTGEAPAVVCRRPAVTGIVEPDPGLADALAARFAAYRALYAASRGARYRAKARASTGRGRMSAKDVRMP